MRRRLAILSTLVLGLLLVAGPAFAADGGGAGEGEGLWTGLIYSAIAGTILGIVAFVDTTTGSNALDDLDHDAGH